MNIRGLRYTEQREQVSEQIPAGLHSKRALGQSYSFCQLQFELPAMSSAVHAKIMFKTLRRDCVKSS